MEIIIHYGRNSESVGLPIHSNIKGVRFQHAIGNIADGAILFHGRDPNIAQNVASIDFIGEWGPDSKAIFTISLFVGEGIYVDDNRVEILTTTDGYNWELTMWLCEECALTEEVCA